MRKHARSRLRHIIQRLGERRQLRIEQTCGLQIVESYDGDILRHLLVEPVKHM